MAWITIAAVVVSLIPNIINLNQQARQIRAFAATERASLGAYGLLHTEVPDSVPNLVRTRVLSVEGQHFRVGGHPGVQVAPARYFEMVHRYSSPGATPRLIASGTEAQRQTVDQILLRGKDLTLSNLPPGSASAHGCRPARRPDRRNGSSFRPPAWSCRPRGSRSNVSVAARRFATGFQELTVPPDLGRCW